jgi:hypothetical protein
VLRLLEQANLFFQNVFVELLEEENWIGWDVVRHGYRPSGLSRIEMALSWNWRKAISHAMRQRFVRGGLADHARWPLADDEVSPKT